MNTTVHAVAPEEVMAYLDGELGAAEAAAVREHMVSCVECAALAGELQATTKALGAWEIEALAGGVDEAMKRRMTGGGGVRERILRRPWVWGLGAGALAAMLLVGIAYMPGTRASAVHSTTKTEAADADWRSSAMAVPPTQSADYSHRGEPAPQAVAGVAGMGGVMGGVGANYTASDLVSAPKRAAPATDAVHQPGSVDVVAGPMIARSASLTILVKDVEAARAAMEITIARHHGYAASLYASTQMNAPRSVQASLRVPAGELGATLNELKTLGRVERESQAGDEVGAQHDDLEARLKTARATEESFRGILRQRSGTVGDVMSVQENIERVRGEIERMEAEEGALEHRVTYASVDLGLTEHVAVRAEAPVDTAGVQVERAAAGGYSHVKESMLGFVLLLVEYGPVTAFWLGLLVLLGWAAVRWSKGRR